MAIPAGPTVTSQIPAEYRPAVAALQDMSLSLDGWTAGATDTQGTTWSLTGLEGWWETPAPRVAIEDRPQDHGGFDDVSWFSSRVLTIEGLAQSPDRATHLRARRIATSVAVDTTTLHTMTVTEPDGTVLRCAVRLSAATKVGDITDTLCRWSMQVCAPDPRRYIDPEILHTLALPASPTGGITFATTAPWVVVGAAASTGSVTAVNVGTFGTRPVLTFIGPLTDPQLEHVQTGRRLAFDIDLAAGETLVVDVDRRAVLLGGTASRSSALAAGSAWFDLAPGDNELRFTAAAGGGTSQLLVRYSSALL